MQCYTNEEALASLFINVSTSFFLLLLLLYSAASLLLKLLHFIGGYPLLQRSEDEYDSAAWFSDEEEEEEEEEEGREFKMSCNTSYHVISRDQNQDHLIADIGDDGESLVFYNKNSQGVLNSRHTKEFINVHQTHEHENEDDQDSNTSSTEEHFSSANVSPYRSESSIEDEDDGVEDLHDDRYDDDDEVIRGVSRYDVVEDLVRKQPNNTSTRGPSRFQSGLVFNDKSYNGEFVSNGGIKNDHDEEIQSSSDLGMREIKAEELEEEEEERGVIFGESCTNGSTSKSSSEWRNSVKTDDPFSSSSRRSCPKWESYTVFQKYDEEMTFLTRISAQKLHETDSLKSILVEPRSFSERIVHKLSSNGHKRKQQQHPSSSIGSRPNPYVELESAYVAQICLTWEALSWNYKNFERKRSSTQRSFNDIGCPAGIADQFRTFHILLQRYVENEPYEHGRRPEIYARMRTLAPKLLLVPEYQDYEEEDEDEKEEGFKSRVSSASFLMIMEECIRTFMNFLKADKEKPCQKIIKAFLGRSKRGSVDPTLVHLTKKVNTKKKTKLKEMRRGGKYMKKKKMSIEEEMEILMGLIDLKVVSRVLRMNDMNEEKLHWCEEKMSKVKIIQGGKVLQRDSTPLFFPPH